MALEVIVRRGGAEDGPPGCLQGARMRTKEALMAEWALAARFPLHFGGTWDALRDALSDLPEGGTFHVREADQVLQDAPAEDGLAWAAVMGAAGEDLEPRILRLVLQVHPDRCGVLLERLATLGLRTEP